MANQARPVDFGYNPPSGTRGWEVFPPETFVRDLQNALDIASQSFSSLWVSDHFFLDISRYGGPAGPQGSLEPFTTLAALAAVTERARLGTLVACAEQLSGPGLAELGLPAFDAPREASAFSWTPSGEA